MKSITIAGETFEIADYQNPLQNSVHSLPYSLRVLAENAARQDPTDQALLHVGARNGEAVPFRPLRLILQDMLGLPLLVDLMAMRSAVVKGGGDPDKIDMSLPVDLIIDHSMTINHWAEKFALPKNQDREFEINYERFAFIKACEARFPNLRVIPPGGGIMHQINLEFLGKTVNRVTPNGNLLAPDTNLGTDSHTPMINALGVLGWGIGGLEAEAIMFGQPTMVNVPRVIGLEVTGTPDDNVTATDVALTVAEKLRSIGVVDCFVELFGAGYRQLSVADRGTIANMAPEYGATSVFCPIDGNTIRYLRETGRSKEHTDMVQAYAQAQGMWVDEVDNRVDYDDLVQLDLGSISRSAAGPSRPEQRIDLANVSSELSFRGEKTEKRRFAVKGQEHDLGDGDVIIAAITSCTNTANPRNMILAGLIAQNAIKRGLTVKPHVKTSLAPGSRVVARYLSESGLQSALDELGFHLAAFSCSTCNGMSGPLSPEHEAAIKEHEIKGVAVLSGNRNFAGRIHPLASRNMLVAPPLVVAYALSGTILNDITTEPLGYDRNGEPVLLSDLWPANHEVDSIIKAHLSASDFIQNYAQISTVSDKWNELGTDNGAYQWSPSTYVTYPSYLNEIETKSKKSLMLTGLRPLVILGDSVTTDHISPSGTITAESAAGSYLISRDVEPRDFNSFGTRRGSSDIVIRSTFANYRLRNEMTPDREGSWTRLEPDGHEIPVFDAIEIYKERGQALIIIGGKDYGCGSSRDTAAKAPWLAGVRAVVVESYERIHRSNLVNMGIAPLQFPEGVTRKTLNLTGKETYDIELTSDMKSAKMTIHREGDASETVPLDLRLYNEAERECFRQGGLLPQVYHRFVDKAA